MDFQIGGPQALQRGRQLGERLLVRVRDARSELPQQPHRGDAAPPQADHGDPLSRYLHRRSFAHDHAHRSFSVLRLKSASSTAMIHRRTTTFGSSQPFSSKW